MAFYDPFVHYAMAVSKEYPPDPCPPVSALLELEPDQKTRILYVDDQCMPCSASEHPKYVIYPSTQLPPPGFTMFYNPPGIYPDTRLDYYPEDMAYHSYNSDNPDVSEEKMTWIRWAGSNTRFVKWGLFSPDHLLLRQEWKEKPNSYVSDGITDEEIAGWLSRPKRNFSPIPYQPPVLISAQTGKGKNYFIMHRLREFAKQRGMSILYVSNRIALDLQQKQELAELTHINRKIFPSDVDRLEDIEEFSNITVLTYHKLYHRLLDKNANEWCKRFRFVVLDECHFFYSDAFFNPFTGDILKRIPQMFPNAVRIYMTATFDDVFEPIRFYEALEDPEDFHEYFDTESHKYFFPRDYSNYTTFFFSEAQQIKEKVQEDSTDGKWIIFVTSKAMGLSLCKELNDGKAAKPIAAFIDAQSRVSDDYTIQVLWKQLCATGRFPGKVLITTSVLDNGFSIKDPEVANVVLFTNDKTEFLQELGRCRLGPGQRINVFIKKLDGASLSRLQQDFNQKNGVILSFCGDKDTARLGESDAYYTEGDPIRTFQLLWNPGPNPCRGFIHPAETSDHKIYPQINTMARWRTKLLGKQLQKYEALFKKNEGMAPIWCKEDWLGGEGGTEDTRYAKERDLDIDSFQLALEKLEAFLDEQVASGNEFIDGEEDFTEFSKQFVELYRAAYKGDKSFNSSRVSEKGVGVQSINNHLQKLVDDGICFELVQVKGSGQKTWVLQRA